MDMLRQITGEPEIRVVMGVVLAVVTEYICRREDGSHSELRRSKVGRGVAGRRRRRRRSRLRGGDFLMRLQ